MNNTNNAPAKRNTKKKATTMAPKTTAPAESASVDADAALKAAVKATKAKFPDHPKPAIELIAAGTLRKLTKDEIGVLRTHKLKKDGSPIVQHVGPRERSAVNAVSVANMIEFSGVEGLKKMHAKYGNDLRKPLAQYVKGLKEGSDDRNAMDALVKALFPSQRKGFTKSDSQKVSKQGRVAILVSDAGITPQSNVKREVITLPDGRRGVFVFAAPASEPAPAQATNAAPAAAPAWAASAQA